MDIFVARQPIFNTEKKIIAYELLYRNSLENFFDPSVGSSRATSIVITNSHINIGMDHLVEDKFAFINFDATLINNQIPKLLNKDRVVIEVLENVIPTREVLSNLLELKQDGYTLALDDFTLDYPYMNTLPLYDLIKVDFMESGLANAKKIIERYSNNNRKFLAEKIETQKEFELAREMGYEYFQGYFFSKPEIIQVDTPIINQPEVAILGTGALVKRPVVVVDQLGEEAIAVRDMMYLSLTYDHRLIDGAVAARFLSTIKTRLEEGDFGAEFGR